MPVNLLSLKLHNNICDFYRHWTLYFNWQGALKIAELLELAKKEIPKEYWAKTPLILKATAGLRMLPQEQADNILNALKELFIKTPFLTDENSIEIMDGTDEGIFSWFTVNFLLSGYLWSLMLIKEVIMVLYR